VKPRGEILGVGGSGNRSAKVPRGV